MRHLGYILSIIVLISCSYKRFLPTDDFNGNPTSLIERRCSYFRENNDSNMTFDYVGYSSFTYNSDHTLQSINHFDSIPNPLQCNRTKTNLVYSTNKRIKSADIIKNDTVYYSIDYFYKPRRIKFNLIDTLGRIKQSTKYIYDLQGRVILVTTNGIDKRKYIYTKDNITTINLDCSNNDVCIETLKPLTFDEKDNWIRAKVYLDNRDEPDILIIRELNYK
ncbi:MAG: hypothetical protein HKP62_07210 [Sulfurovum sp.]|nr:hypothetical protein [Sulfurovum sp.]